MRADQRLTEAYEKARVEYIDANAKYIIFSDCHRGNGSHWDAFSKNRNIYLYALEYYFHNGFTYVEAGDGDELWENPKFTYIRKAHADEFRQIKKFYDKGRFILLYGNHNIYLKNPKYVKKNYFTFYHEHRETTYDLFRGIQPCEALVLRNKTTGQDILIIHGHQGDITAEQFWPFNMFFLKYFWRMFQSLGLQNPTSPVVKAQKWHKIEKNYTKWIEKHRITLICGHTHRYRYPKSYELPYFNTGCCIYPTSISGIEIIGEMIQLVRWKTKVDRGGVLKIKREIFRGPEPLSDFDIRLKTERQAQ